MNGRRWGAYDSGKLVDINVADEKAITQNVRQI